ncbi:hypothetical protein N7449_010695 [Penicillium cf. viridicatum]|uniref:DUF6536 domain-containing protein n=1 Tax=Penicillium cf. viridicatum TaxID=2972119 RepID=A0A9W9J1V5_9EURO|nr:hypothetical protein N7449_010695 [Penicillium cf. viridicatum]
MNTVRYYSNSIPAIGLQAREPAHEEDALLEPPNEHIQHGTDPRPVNRAATQEQRESISTENPDEDEGPHTNESTKGSRPLCYKFANKAMLGQYIPELDEASPRSKTRKNEASKRAKMVRNQLITAVAVCIANIVVLVCFSVLFPPDSLGVGTLRIGDCTDIRTIDSAAHVILNILSSLFLGAGSYCMQILVAPSRREMDAAHARGVSLDIGVPSLRNLKYITRGRILQWLGLGVLSVCLHLFWNSVIFTSTPVVSYARAILTSDFREAGRDWSLDPLPAVLDGKSWASVHALYAEMDNFTRLDKQGCIDAYIDPLTSKSSLVVVAANITSAQNNNKTLLHGWNTGWDVWSRAPWWICEAYNRDEMTLLCTSEWADTLVDNWTVFAWTQHKDPGWPFRVQVDYCIVGAESDISQQCGLHYGVQVLAVVSVCTLIQCFLISVVWLASRSTSGRSKVERTMVLMGDAVAEYLEHRSDLSNYRSVSVYPQVWNPRHRLSWFKSVSKKVWAVSLLLFIIGILAPLVVLIQAVVSWKARGVDLTLLNIAKQGFGVNAGFLGMNSEKGDYSLITCVFLANIVQLLVSFLYLLYNNILTRQLVADQWVRFLRPDGKKPLRVSLPSGMQRSSYILSLPLTYSITLMIIMIVLHWLVSQSLFVVQTIGFDTAGELVHFSSFNGSAVGYSPLGIVLATACGVIMILGLLINSLVRRHENVPAEFPTWGSSSAHIEVMCQRPDQDIDAHLFPSIQPIQDSILNTGWFTTS